MSTDIGPTRRYPFINGHLYSWSSIEFWGNGLNIDGIKAINYSDELVPGLVMAPFSPQPRGKTRGKWRGTGSIEIFRDAFGKFKNSLGVRPEDKDTSRAGTGFMEKPFMIQVHYNEPIRSSFVNDPNHRQGGLGVTTDVINCVLSGLDTSSDSGSTDGTTLKLNLTILTPILWDGVPGPLPI